MLRKSRLVETRREAKQISYRINHDRVRNVSALMDRFAGTVVIGREKVATRRFQCGGSAAMFAQVG